MHPIVRSLTIVSLLPMANAAAAEMKYENGNGGSVLLYGQLDPAYLSFDDGVETTSDFVDNSASNSRVGIWVRQDYGANVLSFNFETALGFRQSGSLSQIFTPKAVNWQRTSIRKVDLSLKTDRFGTFYAGQGSMSTDGVAEVDLSGTTLATYVSIPDTAGAFEFRDSAGALSGRFIAGSFSDFDGARLGRVRYDTPTFAGFTLSASWGKEILAQDSDFESAAIALRYANTIGDFQVQGALGYADAKPSRNVAKFKDTIGSVSVLHASGVSVTLASGDRSDAGNYTYGKLGYQGNWLSIGTTAMSVDYYRGRERTADGSSATSVGFGAVQSFHNANVHAYLGYRTYELTEPDASYQDASSVIFGARWKF
ncbi:porin [Sedimentitalea todarodis]|uniref:Porin n=1 Tax=Sedimentitalea todarodis TaxID=1631240 RepID=A0ABU3VCL5_9RHOB|nr:porin [Sedimentitalea todarodis]MDU9003920.1 porin [Sedimentitalea todarodis]